jgi:glycosyltransferase involved in cell wall biosynthesis
MKRILFIGPYPPPFGGIASHLHELLPELVKNGYEINCLDRSPKTEKITTSGITVIRINLRDYLKKHIFQIIHSYLKFTYINKTIKWAEALRNINFAHAIIKIVRARKIEAIFIYEENAMVIPILRKKLGKSTPIGLMIFGEYYSKQNDYVKIKEYMHKVFNNSDVILSSSRFCGNSIKNIFGFEFPVKVVYVGVNEMVYNPLNDGSKIRTELGIPQNAIVFLFLGRMMSEMGLDFLLNVSERLLSLNKDVYLIIAGAKDDLSFLAKDLSEREHRVKYCLNIPIDKKPHFYSACDIFLAPSKEDHACMGVSIKEAMFCAKPVIASTSGGIPEAIEDDVNGYLIPFLNGELDEKKFLHVAKSLVDNPPLRKNMGNKGREKALHLFTNRQTTNHYLEIIKILKQIGWNKN